jgi:putative flippase GtrA
VRAPRYPSPPMQRDHAVATPPPEAEVGPVEASPEAEVGRAEAPTRVRARLRAEHEVGRVRRGLRHPANWFQLGRFSIVGGTGYVINLVVYSALVEAFSVHYIPAAMLAFCVAVTNNFLLNRHWTFKATHGRATFQAPRFLAVSLIALGFNLLVLELLVGLGGLHKIVGQAAAVLAATPLNFTGNKLWSFRRLTNRPSWSAPRS